MNDIMTGTILEGDGKFSEFDIALLKDTGWYEVKSFLKSEINPSIFYLTTGLRRNS